MGICETTKNSVGNNTQNPSTINNPVNQTQTTTLVNNTNNSLPQSAAVNNIEQLKQNLTNQDNDGPSYDRNVSMGSSLKNED